MKHTYQVSGTITDSSAQHVREALSQIDGVESVEIAMDASRVHIQMSHHIGTDALNNALREVGDFMLQPAKDGDDGHYHGHSEEAHHAPHSGTHGHHDHGGGTDSHAEKHGSGTTSGHAHHHDHEKHHGHDHHHHDHHGGHGHQEHHRMMIVDFKRRFWVTLVLTIPVLLLSPMIQEWLGLDWAFAGDKYILFALSSIIFFYGGYPFLKGLVEELGKKLPGMMTLIAVAITAAYLYSSAVVFGLEGGTFFWELATLIAVMLLGHWLEMKSVLGASKALEALAALMPDTAHLIDGDEVREVKVKDLKPGNLILIKPGEKVPADGVIQEGETDLNESMLTGESKPVTKAADDTVIGGSVNGNGAIKVEVKGTGEDSYLSRVINMVNEAQGQKSKTQRLADKAAFWLTIIALAGGFGTLGVWLAMGRELNFALERMVTVMVICCPHALGLAIPLVAAISTSISAKNGLLIRNRTAFENARKITTIVFDKTGTLTKGSHEVVDIASLSDAYNEEDVLRYATAAESSSEHHIAKGLTKRAKEDNLEIPPSKDFTYEAGVGVSAQVNGKSVRVGGYPLMQKLDIKTPDDTESDAETKVFVVIEDELTGYITFADQIRESSFDAIKLLKENDIKCTLLTGDNDKVAAAVAEELDLTDYMAEVLPEQKQDKIKELQKKGEIVAMTGDGVNDAPALAQADVGIAIGSGTDVAAETADIVLVRSDPKDIASLLLFGKATYRKMVENLVWATGYNAVAMPLATGFIPGLVISPAIGAALMSVSTIICAVNAQLLRRQMR